VLETNPLWDKEICRTKIQIVLFRIVIQSCKVVVFRKLGLPNGFIVENEASNFSSRGFSSSSYEWGDIKWSF